MKGKKSRKKAGKARINEKVLKRRKTFEGCLTRNTLIKRLGKCGR
jgi:hypothetical protein